VHQLHVFLIAEERLEECLKSWQPKFDTFVSRLYELSFKVLQIIQGYLIQRGEARADHLLHCVQNLRPEFGPEMCI